MWIEDITDSSYEQAAIRKQLKNPAWVQIKKCLYPDLFTEGNAYLVLFRDCNDTVNVVNNKGMVVSFRETEIIFLKGNYHKLVKKRKSYFVGGTGHPMGAIAKGIRTGKAFRGK